MPDASTTASTDSSATKTTNPETSGQARYDAASAAAAPIQSRFAPTRSVNRPIGIDSSSVTIADTESPSPTCAPVSPTIWVKKTAVPVRKVPVPNAESTDWTTRLRTNGSAGSTRPITVTVRQSTSAHRQCPPGFSRRRAGRSRRPG